jgi:hypothetical protein
MSRTDLEIVMRRGLDASRAWPGLITPPYSLASRHAPTVWGALIIDAAVVSTTETNVTWSRILRSFWWETAIAPIRHEPDRAFELVTRWKELSSSAKDQLIELGWLSDRQPTPRLRLKGYLYARPSAEARIAVGLGAFDALCACVSLGPCCLSMLFTRFGPRHGRGSAFHDAITLQDIARASQGDILWSIGHLAVGQQTPLIAQAGEGALRTLASRQTGGGEPITSDYADRYRVFRHLARRVWNGKS